MGLDSALDAIYWIGGSPCAGKTSVTQLLAARYGTWAYYFDWHELDHITRSLDEPSAFPALSAFLAVSMDERWVFRSPEAMAESTIASWTERFPLVRQDLREYPVGRSIIVEGAGLFPDSVASVLEDLDHAFWLVPSPAFCRQVRTARRSRVFDDTSDPARGLENLIARDVLLAQHVKARATDLGFRVLEIDGSRSVDDLAAEVELCLRLSTTRGDSRFGQLSSAEDVALCKDTYIGEYTSVDHPGFTVMWSERGLVVSSCASRRSCVLEHHHDQLFRIADGLLAGEMVVFERDEAGGGFRLVIGSRMFERERNTPEGA